LANSSVRNVFAASRLADTRRAEPLSQATAISSPAAATSARPGRTPTASVSVWARGTPPSIARSRSALGSSAVPASCQMTYAVSPAAASSGNQDTRPGSLIHRALHDWPPSSLYASSTCAIGTPPTGSSSTHVTHTRVPAAEIRHESVRQSFGS
jgi:hypothetical protein